MGEAPQETPRLKRSDLGSLGVAAPLNEPALTSLRDGRAVKLAPPVVTQGGAAPADPSVPEILEKLTRARAAGRPVDDLRKALFEAVARFKNTPAGEPDAAGR